MILVSSSWAHTLFDTGVSHLFISVLFPSMLGLEYEHGFHLECEGTFWPTLWAIISLWFSAFWDWSTMILSRFDRHADATICYNTWHGLVISTSSDNWLCMPTSHFIYQKWLSGISSKSSRHLTELDPEIVHQGRWRLEVYNSLFAIESKAKTRTHYPGLHGVKNFLDIFPE